MPEREIVRRSALATKEPIRSTQISLTALPEGHVVHVLAEWDADLSAALAEAVGTAHAVRRIAPGQWFVLGDGQTPFRDLVTSLQRRAPDAAYVDQSHGRVRMLLRGPVVERVLAKGTGVDLALPAFPVGHTAATLFGHIAVHLTRVEEEAFELTVLRGFAESLWDDLSLMCAEFV